MRNPDRGEVGLAGVAVPNGLAYRPNVGFWDDQINELLTGIGELLGGGGAPQQPATPAAGLSPAPDPAETDPAGFTGRGAGEARATDASLTRNARALAQTDRELDQWVSDTDAAHVRARQRLVSLDHEVLRRCAEQRTANRYPGYWPPVTVLPGGHLDLRGHHD